MNSKKQNKMQKPKRKGRTLKRLRHTGSKKVNVSEMKTSKEPDKELSKKDFDEFDMEWRVTHKSLKLLAGAPKPRLQVPAGFSWDNKFSLPNLRKVEGGDYGDDNTDDDTSGQVPSKKKSWKEKQKEKKKLKRSEQTLLDSKREPQSTADFDKLVIKSPNDSAIWIKYINFFLETFELEKARAVAEKALQVIFYREEESKLRVWAEYMKLEDVHGSEQQLKKVFDRALQANDQLKVYNHLVRIYIASEKFDLAEQLYVTMTRKFSYNANVWSGFGLFYFKQGRLEASRKLLQRSLRSLENKEHIAIISKFAQFEFKFGDVERGKTMFENILSNYAKRTDLWSVYIDMMIKVGDPDPVRQLFERVINLNVSAKKMKFFFKKYLDFEKEYGSTETVNAVKLKAIDYVELRAGAENAS